MSSGDLSSGDLTSGGHGPTCRGCRHYYVTHEPQRPHGCRAFGFVAPEMPARIVERESGRACALREEPPAPRPKKRGGGTYA